MTKTEFYSQLKSNARLQGLQAINKKSGLLFSNVSVSINNNIVTIIDNNNNNIIDKTNWNKCFIDNMVSITLDIVKNNIGLQAQ